MRAEIHAQKLNSQLSTLSCSSGTLYICPTPLGNLEDITLRVLRILKEVDLIAAENTTRTQKLLNHFGIRKKLIGYFDAGNPKAKEKKLIQLLQGGANLALVSDAGTPVVSDPGYQLVASCIQEGIPVISLPGPSALITALVGSGLPPHPFLFIGFLPPKSKARREFLKKIADFPWTLIFYEAPHRILESLKDCLEILNDRHAVVARELTKIHEEFIRGNLSALVERVSEQPPKGEITLLVSGSQNRPLTPEELEGEIRSLLEKGLSISEVSRQLANQHELSKNKIYRLALDLSR